MSLDDEVDEIGGVLKLLADDIISGRLTSLDLARELKTYGERLVSIALQQQQRDERILRFITDLSEAAKEFPS